MADVDINRIRPQADDGLDYAPTARGAAGAWREEKGNTRRLFATPVDKDVKGRIREGRRLSRPDERGVC